MASLRTPRFAVGLVLFLMLAVGGGLLLWGSTFVNNMVHDQLRAEKIFLPAKGSAALDPAKFIAVHVTHIADGKTYAEVSTAAQASPDDVIRTTFAAVPQRLNALGGKVVVFGVVTFVATSAACFAAFFIGQAILSAKHIGVSITDPNALRTVIGTSLYLTLLGLLALGLGTLLRKTAGAICAVVGILFVVPVLAGFLPSSLDAVQKFLPSNAGQAIINGGPHQAGAAAQLAPWVGMGVFALYAFGTLALGGLLLQRRDA